MFLILLILGTLAVSSWFWQQYKNRRRERAKWAAIRQQRLNDKRRSRVQKQELENRRREAAKVQLPKPKPERRHYMIKPPAPAPVPQRLRINLDALTRSPETSDRLVDGLSHQYPGKSRRWLTEKAIADLERDRHR